MWWGSVRVFLMGCERCAHHTAGPAHYRRTPWKNDGGVSIDFAVAGKTIATRQVKPDEFDIPFAIDLPLPDQTTTSTLTVSVNGSATVVLLSLGLP